MENINTEENINKLGQTPENIKELAETRLEQAEKILESLKASKAEAEANNDADAIALAETRIDHAEAAVETAKRGL